MIHATGSLWQAQGVTFSFLNCHLSLPVIPFFVDTVLLLQYVRQLSFNSSYSSATLCTESPVPSIFSLLFLSCSIREQESSSVHSSCKSWEHSSVSLFSLTWLAWAKGMRTAIVAECWIDSCCFLVQCDPFPSEPFHI